MTTIHLTAKQVPTVLLQAFDYNGRKFQARITETVNICDTQYSCGSRSRYVAVNLTTGKLNPVRDIRPYPENQTPMGDVTIPEDCAIVEHSMFCGKDMGLHFHIRAVNAAKLLPAPVTLEHEEAVVLAVTCGLKSFARRDEAQRHGVDAQAYEQAKARLIASGYLTKNGGASPKGRNVDTGIKIR